ncbi:MAG: hypothetical protein K2X93_14585 [Candidatus Obscuribacterales bacterium]|nr:hypothetical protein [Candidatus Obscuribacterales bacterium]
MYPVDKLERKTYLKNLALPKSLEKLCFAESAFDNEFGVNEPWKVYSRGMSIWDEEEVATFLPLWEIGTTVWAFDLAKEHFLSFSLEAMSDQPTIMCSSVDGLKVWLLASFIESELDEIPDRSLSKLKKSKRLAKSLHFALLEQLAIAIVEFQEDYRESYNQTLSLDDKLVEFCSKHSL